MEELIKKAQNENLVIFIDAKNNLFSKYNETIIREIKYFCSKSKYDKENKSWKLVDTSEYQGKADMIKILEKKGFTFLN